MVLRPYSLAGRSTCHGTIKETRLNIAVKKKKKIHEQYRDILMTDLGIQSYLCLVQSTKVPSDYKHYWYNNFHFCLLEFTLALIIVS